MSSRAWVLTGAAVAVGLSLHGLLSLASASPVISVKQDLPSAALQRQMVSVLIRERGGTQLGSGVVVGSLPGGYWVATNQHVVQGQSTVCIVAADRKTRAGLVWPKTNMQANEDLDLALIWLPHTSKDPLLVASIRRTKSDTGQLPLVIATGYPTSLQPQLNGPTYTESPGLLVALLQNPLQGGFDLTYTAEVVKGMSGGGVFEGIELVGINGAHANPLWPGQWNGQDGKAVEDALQQKLERVSIGISSDRIQKLLKTAPSQSIEFQTQTTEKKSCDPYNL